MPVTISLPQLGAAMRVTDDKTAPEEPLLSILRRLLEVATAEISEYTGSDYADLNDDVANQAAVMVAGYLFDMDPAGKGKIPPNAMIDSGARALLASYRSPSFGSF